MTSSFSIQHGVKDWRDKQKKKVQTWTFEKRKESERAEDKRFDGNENKFLVNLIFVFVSVKLVFA